MKRNTIISKNDGLKCENESSSKTTETLGYIQVLVFEKLWRIESREERFASMLRLHAWCRRMRQHITASSWQTVKH
jgi:hypothetical protein